MKCLCARSATLLILLGALNSRAWCQDTEPNLVPVPPMPAIGNGYGYQVTRAAATDGLWGELQISPVQMSPIQPSPLQSPAQLSPMQKDSPVISPDYSDALKGGYESCSTCMGGGINCWHNHYIYANALVMSALKPCEFVTSVDDVSGAPRLNYGSSEFGNIWRGGFEIGAGWCFGGGGGGCGPNCALELVYWGLFPTASRVRSFDNLSSTIDFGDLDYNGTNANAAFTNAEAQAIQHSFGFNSVEANLVGNSWGGGPFGCGMCGCGSGGGRWGFGYTAGFRYINFFDRFLYSSSPTFDLATDPAALNYLVATTNNLFGFQLGAGLSYCCGQRFTLYVIGKAGVYDNSVTALQRVYGTQGAAVINNGAFAGQDFDVRTAPKSMLATSGQIDLGGRWMINNCWTANFGYRVLGLAGVATTDTNIHTQNFHDVDGVASTSRCGSVLLHGVYAGAVYCW
jgi:Putative beta barrel porin-7 (BBP7)